MVIALRRERRTCGIAISLDTMECNEEESGQQYAILFDLAQPRPRETCCLEGEGARNATTEEDRTVPARRGGCRRQVEVLGLVSPAGWPKTHRRIAAAHSSGEPPDAHAATARTGRGRRAAPHGLPATPA